MPIHLRPTACLAERVLLPGDPGRALLLAQTLLHEPRMFNHHRGLWGYTGLAGDGEPLTVQSTGMGGPSMAIVVTELAELGAKRLVRVGTCGALDPALRLGELVIATEALPEDGTSRALGAVGALPADRRLAEGLRAAAGVGTHSGLIVSTDLFYDTPAATERGWADQGALAVEMETAVLFALAIRRRLPAASLLLVTDLVPTRSRIDDRSLHPGEARLGEVALEALTRTGPAPSAART